MLPLPFGLTALIAFYYYRRRELIRGTINAEQCLLTLAKQVSSLPSLLLFHR
ncbi:uncharacterized protein LACBIDRAFT_303347 [Laccaria bicolor S238N-H82]|uniref:Predicted protein n=1 Tax=Laccaria bicolor (strain S238N-H82 / ATCC MYA-4686) TaxID=486041 RepID=B0DJC8_LACBS|nr:uncharacterized protein LACBIDRAFT_303347 [Laccaria bicolor S238N-H82]EDR05384.1 predicted protein [Laccaria bicolor S238N-H82]|eukprot:XP_001883942.1 predicted protein [Laccaria bicolor S238N-H82]